MALSIEGKVEVRCTLDQAWSLFSRFGDVASLIPSVESVEVDGDVVHAKLCTRLGALPVSSRVRLEVVERTPYACLKAEGVSYLGETVRDQVGKMKGVERDSVGRMTLHLDLRSTEAPDRIAVIYSAEVEAEGRLKRIYQAILKTKAPGMMEEFAQNIRGALERQSAARVTPESVREAATPVEPSQAAPAAEPSVAPAPASANGAIVVEAGWWQRLGSWLRRLLARVWGDR